MVVCFRAEWMFLKRLDHGSQAVMTRFCGLMVVCFRAEWMFLKRLDHGSQAVMTRYSGLGWLFRGWVIVSKRLDHGSSP